MTATASISRRCREKFSTATLPWPRNSCTGSGEALAPNATLLVDSLNINNCATTLAAVEGGAHVRAPALAPLVRVSESVRPAIPAVQHAARRRYPAMARQPRRHRVRRSQARNVSRKRQRCSLYFWQTSWATPHVTGLPLLAQISSRSCWTRVQLSANSLRPRSIIRCIEHGALNPRYMCTVVRVAGRY